eukprot:m.1273775 g.1273775  ORF g.1273775 m.1273775 type:complete len:59 (-) comp24755_c1_seq28:1596-1772(-)
MSLFLKRCAIFANNTASMSTSAAAKLTGMLVFLSVDTCNRYCTVPTQFRMFHPNVNYS